MKGSNAVKMLKTSLMPENGCYGAAMDLNLSKFISYVFQMYMTSNN